LSIGWRTLDKDGSAAGMAVDSTGAMAKARRSKTGEPVPPDSADDTNTITSPQADRDETGRGYSPDDVAARAYELYLARGAADGQDFDDWLAAERELSSARGPGGRSAGTPQGEPIE
jgi:hypothetical protein